MFRKIASSSVKRTPRNDNVVVLEVRDTGSWRLSRQLPVSLTSSNIVCHCEEPSKILWSEKTFNVFIGDEAIFLKAVKYCV